MKRSAVWKLSALALAVAVGVLGVATSASGSFAGSGKQVLSGVGFLQETLPYGKTRTLLVSTDLEGGKGAITRLLGNGRVDRSFGDQGQVKIPLMDAAVQKDGKILVLAMTGSALENRSTDPIVTRLLPNGALDRSFGGDGTVEEDLGGRYDDGTAVAALPDGGIAIAGGSANRYSSRVGAIPERWVVERLRPGGAPDPSFGQGGRVTTVDGVQDLKPGPRGSLFVFGSEILGSEISKLRPHGGSDRSFGGGGVAVVPPIAGGEELPLLLNQKFDVFPNGGIVVSGTYSPEGHQHYRAGVVRLRPNGSPDPRFGGDGTVAVGFPGGWMFGSSVLARPNGKVLVLGSSQVPAGATSRLSAISLQPNGKLDRRFGQGGRTRIGYPADVFGVDLVVRGRNAVLAGDVSGGGGTLLARVPLARPARAR